MESAVSFAPLRPADFVNFAGRGKACFLRGGAACFSTGRGGAGRPSLVSAPLCMFDYQQKLRKKYEKRKAIYCNSYQISQRSMTSICCKGLVIFWMLILRRLLPIKGHWWEKGWIYYHLFVCSYISILVHPVNILSSVCLFVCLSKAPETDTNRNVRS